MSDATRNDARVRAAQNRWYLYNSIGDPAFGRSPHVRAVIEEVCDEILNGDGGPKRTMRNVFLDATDVRDAPTPRPSSESAAYDGLDWRLENEVDDEEFQRLIDGGAVVPISSP